MHRRRRIGCIWDLDPATDAPYWPYEDYEQVFLAAFQFTFGRPPSQWRINGYLQRYFRFGVVPAWVRSYVHDELQGVSVANLASAPLDPQFDLAPAIERLGVFLGLRPPPPPARPGHREYWFRA